MPLSCREKDHSSNASGAIRHSSAALPTGIRGHTTWSPSPIRRPGTQGLARPHFSLITQLEWCVNVGRASRGGSLNQCCPDCHSFNTNFITFAATCTDLNSTFNTICITAFADLSSTSRESCFFLPLLNLHIYAIT